MARKGSKWKMSWRIVLLHILHWIMLAMTSRNLRSNTIFECLCSSSIPLYYSSNSDQFNHDSNYIRGIVNFGRVWLHQMKELEGGEKATQHRDHPFRTSANFTLFWTPPPVPSVGRFFSTVHQQMLMKFDTSPLQFADVLNGWSHTLYNSLGWSWTWARACIPGMPETEGLEGGGGGRA